ncbi:MAG: hypothetical protein ACKVVT_12155 [Dehalococcoidia bacterium]
MAVDGTWNITIKTPMGDRPATLTLESAGGLSGTFSNQRGSGPIYDASAEGDSFTCSADFEGAMGKMKLVFKGTVAGDNLNGEVEFGPMGAGPFSGTRG